MGSGGGWGWGVGDTAVTCRSDGQTFLPPPPPPGLRLLLPPSQFSQTLTEINNYL